MNKRKKQIYMMIIFSLALVIGIGYAFLNSNLSITGNTKIKENSWDVHFENFSPKSGSVTPTSAGISGTNAVNYTITLAKPGDFYEFTVDAVNDGSIDAMISTVSNTGLTQEQKKYMSYTAEYTSGADLIEKQELKAGTSETFKVRVEYKKDISASDLPETNQNLTLTFTANYVQADGSAIVVNHPICKRATTLHNDETSTYGSLGTKGTLTVGDAFDCDVNGDGTFNSENERFYYITDLDTDSNYGVLIYYSNVSNGEAIEAKLVPYMSPSDREAAGKYGPQTAIKQLPTTSQWSKVSLSNPIRNIKNLYGEVLVSEFSYAGYAARLLAREDIFTACYDGEHATTSSDGLYVKCSFLGEGGLPYYIETLTHQTSGNGIKKTTTNHPYIGSFAPYDVNYSMGSVRPVIEVLKSKIKY